MAAFLWYLATVQQSVQLSPSISFLILFVHIWQCCHDICIIKLWNFKNQSIRTFMYKLNKLPFKQFEATYHKCPCSSSGLFGQANLSSLPAIVVCLPIPGMVVKYFLDGCNLCYLPPSLPPSLPSMKNRSPQCLLKVNFVSWRRVGRTGRIG